MTLNEFLAKAQNLFSFAEKADKNLAAEEKLSEAQKRITDLQLENANIAGERDRLKSELASQVALIKDLDEKHKAALAAKDAEVDTRAAAKALEITAAQGQPPLPETANTGTNATTDTYELVQVALTKETDPAKAAELAKKCRKLRGQENLFAPKK